MMADRQMTMVIVTRIRQPTTVWRCGSCGPESCRVLSCGWSCRCIRVSTTQHLNDVTSQQTSQRCNVSSQRTSQRLNDATCQRVNASTCLNERLNVSTTQRVNVSTCQRVSTNVSTTQRVNVSTSQRMCQRLNDATCKRVNVSTNVSTSQQRSCGVSCSLVATSFSCGLGAEVLLLNSTYHAVSINTTVGCHTLVTLSRRTVSHTRIVCVTHWDCVRVAGQPWRVEFSAVTVGTVMLLLVSPGETNSSEKEHSR